MKSLDQRFAHDEQKPINNSPANELTRQLGDLMAKQNFFASQENQYMVDSLEDRISVIREKIAAYEKAEEERRKLRKDDE